ncbi:MAG: hypothetical protein R3F19_30720 [Verrucomicrobiales bacterium]
MTSPNLNMRDPVIYRIQRLTHYRTGDAWCIYIAVVLRTPLMHSKGSRIPCAHWSSKTTGPVELVRGALPGAEHLRQIEFARLAHLHRDEQA